MSDEQQNPLLRARGLPPFSELRAEHALPAVESRLADARDAVARGAAHPDPTWETVVVPLEEAHDRLSKTWSPVRHLHAVADTPAWREAYNACLPKITDYYTEVGQNKALFDAYERIAGSDAAVRFDAAERTVIEHALREFRLSGVDLEDAAKTRFRALSAELSALGSKFAEHVLDATEGWTKPIDDARRLRGLPESALERAAARARDQQLAGWLLALDQPSYLAVMTHADDRELRREVYTAYVTRASSEGPHAGRWDNGPLIAQILAKRHELAALLGFASYAEYSLERKMADSPHQVLDFLRDLARRSKPVAERDLAELETFARETLGYEELAAWDIAYASEKLRVHRYALAQEALRPYFPLPRVLAGLFTIVERLFGVVLQEAEADRWHEDVRFYQVRDGDGGLRGELFVDAYARAGKRGGAWMDGSVDRRRTAHGVQNPVAYVNCNFSPPVGEAPSLLTHEEVITLFHEFGHALHHLLTRVDYAPVSGINGVPWDAVELPSQFLEHWCWEAETLPLLTAHVQTGAPLPSAMIEQLRAARNFQSGMQMVRQLEFALFDLRAHLEYDPARPRPVESLIAEVREEVAVVRPPPFNRFTHAFTHVFAGGYAAGYYSYKWAEVLACDAFSAFESEGLLEPKTGARFLHAILERGGAEDALALFREFRGRDPSNDALLRHSGIEADGESAPAAGVASARA